MRNREKILLSFIEMGNSMKLFFTLPLIQEFMFILSQFNLERHFYYFYWFNSKPQSSRLIHDILYYQNQGIITSNYQFNNKIQKSYLLSNKIESQLKSIMTQYIHDENRLQYIFAIQHSTNLITSNFIGTIGYEKKDIDCFISKLLDIGCQLLIDVRFNAISMNTDYSKKQLEAYLKNVNIKYIHMSELGIPSKMRNQIKTSENSNIAKTEMFEFYKSQILPLKYNLIDNILHKYPNTNKVFMCFEQNVIDCHRQYIRDYIIRKKMTVIDL